MHLGMLCLKSKFVVDLLWSAFVDDTDLRSAERERERERERNRGSDHINQQIHPILTFTTTIFGKWLFYPPKKNLCIFMNQPFSQMSCISKLKISGHYKNTNTPFSDCPNDTTCGHKLGDFGLDRMGPFTQNFH